MKWKIVIDSEPEMEALDKTNALLLFSHYVMQYPNKKVTLTYDGTYDPRTSSSAASR